jgi:glycosyltransferase involved in cell wall biosynthesis|tara:strand:- start:604 stop:1761 length:1158 start_codon:yes stop_codon:yes gene_type:complete
MSSKIKILQVIPKLGYGGAETGCFDLAHYLHEHNCKSYIVTSGGPLLKYINKKKVKILRLPVQSKNPILILLNSILLTLIIFFLNVDIVHARSRAPAWSCLIATKLTRRKFVTTFHGTYNFKSDLKKWYNSVMVRSDLIIAGSNFIFSHIKENYSKYLSNKKKFLVIFRGINTDYFNPKKIKESDKNLLKKKWNITDEKKIILLPGRLTEWKGQEMFIEAISLLKKNLSEIEFIAVILGSDQGRKIYKKKLIRLVEQHRLSGNVIFVDHLELMPIAYEISTVIVSSSIEPEAFGRVSVEAQSMEKPIVASNIGGSNETIINDKTGFLFKAGDSKNLSEKLKEVLNLSELTLNGIGAEGRKNIIAKFNVEKMCNTTYSEYKKLINA